MYKLLALVLVLAIIVSCDDIGGTGTGDPTATLTVQDVSSFETNENNNFTFEVVMTTASDVEVKVDYETDADTAEEDDDFLPVSGTLTFAPGITSLTIDVEVIGDEAKEIDEQFFMLISNPVNATILKSKGTATIRNEDDTFVIPEDGYATPESYGGYTLVWQDEFNGNSINTNDWTHEIGASGWGNQESQYYTNSPNNSYVSDGNLVIEAIEEDFEGAPYTSARMITKDKQEFTFGRVDIRAILPEGQGIWPALWMLGDNIDIVGWPHCGEIDIMEMIGHEPSTVHGTAHWGPEGNAWSFNNGNDYNLSSEKFIDEYHVFSIIWELDNITWYVDDVQYFTLNKTNVNGDYPFNAPFFFIFNVAVGGLWPGYPDETTVFPQRMLVDYIRVFERN